MATVKSFWEATWRKLPDVVRDGPLSNPQNRLPSNQAYDLLKEMFPSLPSQLRARRHRNHALTSEDQRVLETAVADHAENLVYASQLAAAILVLLKEFSNHATVIASTKSRSKSGARAEAALLTKQLLQERGRSVLQPPLDRPGLRTWVIRHYALAPQPAEQIPLTKHAVLAWCEDPEVQRELTDEITRLWASRREVADPVGFTSLPLFEANPFPHDLEASSSVLDRAMAQAAEFLSDQDPHHVECYLCLRTNDENIAAPVLLPPVLGSRRKPAPLELSVVDQVQQALSHVVPRATTIRELMREAIRLACGDFGLTHPSDHHLLVVAASLVQFPIDSDISVAPELAPKSAAPHHISELFNYIMRRFFGGASASELPRAAREMLASPILFVSGAVWRRLYHHTLAGHHEPPHLTLNRAFVGWLRAYAATAETAIMLDLDASETGSGQERAPAEYRDALDIMDALLTDRTGVRLLREFAVAIRSGETPRQWAALEARAAHLLSGTGAEDLLAGFTYDTAASLIQSLIRPDAGTHDADRSR